ncbi:MAG: ABC transporter ATP-binding protein [Promethearchaeota archaeon]
MEQSNKRNEFKRLFGFFFENRVSRKQNKELKKKQKRENKQEKEEKGKKKSPKTSKKKRNHSDKDLMLYLWSYIKPYKGRFYTLAFFMMVTVALGILAPLFYQEGLALVEAQDLNPELSKIFPFLLAYILIVMFKWFTEAFQRSTAVQLNSFVSNDMRKRVFSDVLKNKIKFFDNAETGVLTGNITNDLQELYDTGERFVQVFTNLVRLVVTVAILFSFSPRLTGISMAFLPLFSLVAISLRKFSRRVARVWRKNFGKVNQSFSESMRSISVSKAFEREEENIRRFSDLNELTYKSSVQRGFAIFVMGPISDFLRHFLLVIILWVGTLEYNSQNITLAAFSLFIIMFDYYFYPLMSLARHYNRFQAMFGILERLLESSEKEELIEPDNYDIKPLSMQGDIEFRNVDFEYIKDTQILKNLTFKAKKGERIALVGPTGAGKTTIASIVMRFYDIKSGEILIDGKNIYDYDLTALRKSIGLVSQRVLLIKGTIRENLQLGNETATDAQIWEALDRVQAREFIELLPNGLDSTVSEKGKNLSAGQRQMISFARVLLADPKLIILDEATSAVDLYTEAKIQDAIDILLENRTSIVIAHRLTTILKSDLIVVIQDGEILEQGTHHELLAKNGPYHEMYNLYFETQSAKYLETIKTSR